MQWRNQLDFLSSQGNSLLFRSQASKRVNERTSEWPCKTVKKVIYIHRYESELWGQTGWFHPFSHCLIRESQLSHIIIPRDCLQSQPNISHNQTSRCSRQFSSLTFSPTHAHSNYSPCGLLRSLGSCAYSWSVFHMLCTAPSLWVSFHFPTIP